MTDEQRLLPQKAFWPYVMGFYDGVLHRQREDEMPTYGEIIEAARIEYMQLPLPLRVEEWFNERTTL